MATVVKSLKFRKASQQISREVFFDKSISTLSKLVRLAEDAICNAAASISFIKFRRCALEFRGSSPLLIFFKYFLKEIVFTLWHISATVLRVKVSLLTKSLTRARAICPWKFGIFIATISENNFFSVKYKP